MARSKNKKTKKANKNKFLRDMKVPLLFILCLTLAAGLFLIYNLYRQQTIASVALNPGTNVKIDFGHSLDLRVAAKASFPSEPIRVTDNKLTPRGFPAKEFRYEVKYDKLTEYGLMVLPQTPQPQAGYPVVVLLHGFATADSYKTDQAYIEDMEFYADHGYAVLKPDLRGQGLSINSGHQDSGYYSMAYNTDIMSLLTAVKQTPYLDSSNVSLWGHSLGAYLALRAAVLAPGIKNLILLAPPVDSLPKMYFTFVPSSDSRDPYALKTRVEVFAKYHAPSYNSDFWKNASPINFLDKLTARVQIHVGGDDKVVSPVFAEDLHKALLKQGVEHGYFVYPNAAHGLQAERSKIWHLSLEQLDNLQIQQS